MIRVLGLAVACLSLAASASATTDALPEHVTVRPVFFVTSGQSAPTEAQIAKLIAHLEWAQERYAEMLGCRDTFTIHPAGVQIVQGLFANNTYAGMFEGGVPQITSELLAHFGVNRFNSPHVYVTIVMNGQEDWPPGGGRPLNGGYNTGAGVLVMSSYALDFVPNFQSTLQHELGHAFGLPHVNVYGYSMQFNDSIMSYNPDHHTSFFEPSDTPGILIPEDIRGLGFNDRVFPNLAFDPWSDIPDGYVIQDPVWLGPMTIPGQLAYDVDASTPSGEAFGSSVDHVAQGQIKPDAGPGITFDPNTMWHSAQTSPGGWVDVTLEFPCPVTLDAVAVHSRHSLEFHPAEALILTAVVNQVEQIGVIAELNTPDQTVSFAPKTSDQWRFQLQTGPSGYVVVRGLQFFHDDVEYFPPFIPADPEPVPSSACPWDLDSSGLIGSGDLAILLASWGDSPGGAADFNCDGIVDSADLADLLAQWGACG